MARFGQQSTHPKEAFKASKELLGRKRDGRLGVFGNGSSNQTLGLEIEYRRKHRFFLLIRFLCGF